MRKKTLMKKKKTSTAPYIPEEPVYKPPTIPRDVLENLVGYVENLYKIECKWVFPDGEGERYRVNVYTETYVDGSLYPRIRMGQSFSVYYDGETIIDKTEKPKLK